MVENLRKAMVPKIWHFSQQPYDGTKSIRHKEIVNKINKDYNNIIDKITLRQ